MASNTFVGGYVSPLGANHGPPWSSSALAAFQTRFFGGVLSIAGHVTDLSGNPQVRQVALIAWPELRCLGAQDSAADGSYGFHNLRIRTVGRFFAIALQRAGILGLGGRDELTPV